MSETEAPTASRALQTLRRFPLPFVDDSDGLGWVRHETISIRCGWRTAQAANFEIVCGRRDLENAFGAGHAFDARIDLGGDVERPGERFKNAFGHVMRVAAGENFDVQIHGRAD